MPLPPPKAKKPPPEVAALRALVQSRGLRHAAEETGLHRESLSKLLAGLLVREGTREMLRKWMRERQVGGADA